MKFYKFSYLCLATIFCFSCNKFLDKQPDNRTELDSPEKVRLLLATAYPQAGYQKICELMSDNAQDRTPLMQITQMDSTYYSFGDFISDEGSQDSPTYIWSQCYKAIAAANAALDAIANASNQDDYAAEKGEALVCRAFSHFMLVTFFAKPYNEATSEKDMGIPYVTKPEKVALEHYERGTVQEDYEMIDKDLQEGMPLIDDDIYSVPKYHFTKVAARAFATRFYLYKHEYQKAVDFATQAFSNSAAFLANLRKWSVYATSYTIPEFYQNYTKADDNSNLLLIEASSLWARNFYDSRFGFVPDMFGKVFFVSSPSVANGGRWYQSKTIVGSENSWGLPKWNEYFYAPNDPSYGLPYIMMPVLSTEEVLFNKAEANIYLGNYQAALDDLNLFIRNCLQNYTANDNLTIDNATKFYNTADTKSALIQSLLFLKRIEFIQEGMRWFDDLRYGIKIEHKMVNTAKQTTATFISDSTDPRRQWQLPQATIAAGIPANPR